jgi:hypothetical protein
MDPFSTLFSWQFVIFSLGIAAITYPLRLIVDFFATSKRVLKFWSDVALPTIPIFVGVGLGYVAAMFPFPDGLSAGWSRMIWGSVAGMFSTIMYRITKAFFKTWAPSIDDKPAEKPKTPVIPPATAKPSKHKGKKKGKKPGK